MDWIQTLIIISCVIICACFVHLNIREDIKKVNSRIDQCNARTDKLYEMFIELVKNK